jgi:hypothetical protein
MSNGDIYKLVDVFTPTKPARLTFVERKDIGNRLVLGLKTPGKQIIVYGHSGSGKTSLLVNELQNHYAGWVTTRCTSGMRFEQLLLDALDQLGSFYEAERNRSAGRSLSSTVGAEYFGLKAQVNSNAIAANGTTHHRLLPPQLTAQTLARFLGAAGYCWVLEDFHRIDSKEKIKLSQVMKLFMDMADHYPNVRIIAIGAVDTAREVIDYNPEMRNRVTEVHVPLMKVGELQKIIEMGEAWLNIGIPDGIKAVIVKYSNGLASVCHELCLDTCFAAGVTETRALHWNITDLEFTSAIETYLNSASDTLKSAFDKALRQIRKRKFDNGRLIIRALAKFQQDGATLAELLAAIRKDEPAYKSGNLKPYLMKLQSEDRGSLVRYDSSSGRWSFSDPIYRVFAMTLFSKSSRLATASVTEIDIDAAIEDARRLLEAFRAQTAALTA